MKKKYKTIKTPATEGSISVKDAKRATESLKKTKIFKLQVELDMEFEVAQDVSKKQLMLVKKEISRQLPILKYYYIYLGVRRYDCKCLDVRALDV